MATNEESSMIISTEPESTVPLDNNRVTAETVTGTGGIPNVALLVEIQKLRAELIVTTEESRKKQEEMLQKFELKTENKIEDMKKEMAEKLEALTSKVLKSNDDSEKSDMNVCQNTANVPKRECGHLGLYVRCDPNAPAQTCSIRTKIEFKVLNRNQDVVIRTWECCYRMNEGWGFPSFLEWEDMKKWYLLDGNLRVEAKVTIIETTGLGKMKIRKFDESQKDVSDVILVVRDTKFYVLKMFLASQSSVFKALLLGSFSESQQSEVTLNGIDPDDFHYFLEVLYGESAIDDTTVEGVALLADMYNAPTAIQRCEEFLLKESKKTSEKKLKIATRYNLEELKENCL